jgi:putative FmdB family regulatory protein
MPTYEYTCPDGHDFEHFVLKMSQGSAQLPCPVCGKPSERKISAGGGLVFKGSGFYITDYGKDGKKDQRAGAKSGASASEGGAQAESSTTAGARESSKESAKESPKEATKEATKVSPSAAPATAPAPKKKGDSE